MTLQVMSAISTSTNVHIYINRNDIPDTTVSTGLANSRTLNFREEDGESRNVRITIAGTFGSGSASGNVAVDYGPGRNGAFFFPLFSTSTNFTTAVPLEVGNVIRIRTIWTSAAAAIGMSINAWIG